MKNTRNFVVASLLLLSVSFAMAQNSWTAGGTSQNWSDGANWSGGAPGATDNLYFEDSLYSGWTNQAKVVNNVVNANTSVGAINYTATSYTTGKHFHTTLIPGGVTLTLGGLGATPPAALAVGDVPGSLGWFNTSGRTNYSTITGAGSLVVNDTASMISVGMRNRATLDLTGLNNFTANVKQLWVGASSDNPNANGPTGWLMLAKTNNITIAPGVTVPGFLMGQVTNANAKGTAMVQLGQVNHFNADAFTVGGRSANNGSTLSFGSGYPNPSFKLRGSAGGSTPVSVFSIGDLSANWDGYNTASPGTYSTVYNVVADFSGGSVDILADSIYVGRSGSPATSLLYGGGGYGILIAEQGTITATNVYVGYKSPGSTDNTIGQGKLLLRSNAVMNVVQDFSLCFRTNGTGWIDYIELGVSNNAHLNIGGQLTSVNVNNFNYYPSIISLGGGTINMTGGGTVAVPALAGGGYLTNASNITVSKQLSIGTDSTAGTLHLGNKLTLSSGVGLTFNLGSSTTVGGGVNDYLEVSGDVVFSNNVINLSFYSPPAAGTYTLIQYGGTQTGTVTLNNPTRYPIGLVQGGGQIAIVVSNATPANLVWKASGSSGNWNKTALYWNNNTDKFYDFDNVRFDDTGVATTVKVAGGTNFPNSITVSNVAKDYTLDQNWDGYIGGFTSFTKDGAGTLTMSGYNPNLFTGPVNINAGTVKLGSFNTGIFGQAGASTPITIASGSMLDVNGNTLGSGGDYGRPVNVAGTGLGGKGAIAYVTTLLSGSPTLYTPQLTLTANASVGVAGADKSLTLGGVFAPYSGVINLAGNTLTTTGAGEVRIYQMTVTNTGDISVQGPSLGIRNSIIDGPGSINLGNNTLNFYNEFTAGYVGKTITATNGVIMASSTGAAAIPLSSPINLATGGSLTVNNLQAIEASGIISGNAGLTKIGPASLVLSATNSFTGSTFVNEGTLSLAALGTVVSPAIIVGSGGVLDVTAKGAGYTVPSGQTVIVDGVANGNFNLGAGGTLRGSATVAGSVDVASGGTLASGLPVMTGTLTISSNLTFNGGTNDFKLGGPNDLIVVGGNLNFAAPTAIRVIPIGPLGTNVLYQYSGGLSGTNNIQFVTPRPLVCTLDTSTPGVLAVIISGTATMDWKGGYAGSPTEWDVSTSTNWLNAGNPDVFVKNDYVAFGDTALTNVVHLSTTMSPATMTFNNATTPYTLTGAGGIEAGSLTTSGGANVTLANNGNITMLGAGLVLNAGTLTFNQASNSTLTTKLAGSAGVAKSGSSTLTIKSSDSTGFYGTVAVNGGTLRSGSADALGNGSVTVTSGATLDVNGQVGILSTVSVSGTGTDGQGAINNRGAEQMNALDSVTLNGDTTLGAASNRWDIGTGYLSGNNYKLTKTGAADVWIRPESDTGLGDIDVQAGRLVFGGVGTLLGNTSSNIVVRTNAALGFADGVQDPGKSTVIQAGGSLYASGPSNQFGGSISLGSGLIEMELSSELSLQGNISGAAQLHVRGTSPGASGVLTLGGINTYTGGTLVNDGRLIFATSNSIPAISNIVLSSRVPYYQSGHPEVALGTGVVSPAGVELVMQTDGEAGAAQAGLSGDGGTWSGPILLTGTDYSCEAYFAATTNGLTIQGTVDGSGFTGGGSVRISGDGCDTTTLEGAGIRFNSPLVFDGSLNQTEFGGSGGSPQMPKLFLGSSGNSWWSMTFYRGLIQIGADDALPIGATINAGHFFDGDHRFILDLNGHNQTLTDLQTGWPGNDAIWFGNSSTNSDSVLTFNGSEWSPNTWAVFIVDAFDTNAPIQRKTSLSVIGGFLYLNDQGGWKDTNVYFFPPSGPVANTYTGPTTVSGGTLEVDVDLGPSPVTVNGTGTLMGIGVLQGSLAVAPGGILAPGQYVQDPWWGNYSVIGALTVNNNVTLAGDCTMKMDLTYGVACDQLICASNLTYGGTITITDVGAQPITNGVVLPLFSAASYTPGPVTIIPSTPAYGLRWDTSYLAGDGTLRVAPVNTTPVPITQSRSGSNLQLSWPADYIGWRLEAQTNNLSTGLSSTWYPVGGTSTTNTYSATIDANQPSVFYRLVYP